MERTVICQYCHAEVPENEATLVGVAPYDDEDGDAQEGEMWWCGCAEPEPEDEPE